MYKIISINDKEFLHKLERVYYEHNGRQNVVNYMYLNNLNHSENFIELWEEYLVYMKIYDSMKKQLETLYILPFVEEYNIQNYKWEVDFDNERVKLYEYTK